MLEIELILAAALFAFSFGVSRKPSRREKKGQRVIGPCGRAKLSLSPRARGSDALDRIFEGSDRGEGDLGGESGRLFFFFVASKKTKEAAVKEQGVPSPVGSSTFESLYSSSLSSLPVPF